MPADDEDDLTRIRGIGPVRQTWLRERLGIRSFADLAVLDADRARLALLGRPSAPSAEEIARWIRDARKFTGRKQAVTDSNGVEVAAPARDWTSMSTFIIDFLIQDKPDQALAFKTLAEQMESDASSNQAHAEWLGIETRAPNVWMLERLRATLEARGLSAAALESASLTTEPSALAQDVGAPVSELDPSVSLDATARWRVKDPSARAVLERVDVRVGRGHDQRVPPFLRGEPLRLLRGVPISMEVTFSLEGELDSRKGVTTAVFVATLLILDLSSGFTRRMRGDELRAPGVARGTAPIRLDPLPPGRYCCWISVTDPDFAVGPATERGPNLLID